MSAETRTLTLAERQEISRDIFERAQQKAIEAGFEQGFELGLHKGRNEALPIAFADCEALVAAGLLALAEKEEAKRVPCAAEIWHGPGHQSRTRCQIAGKHEIHEAVYGSYDQFARWRGEKTFSGYHDDPPWLDEEDVSREQVASQEAITMLRSAALAVSLGQFRTADCNEKAIVAAHREAAGFNSSKAGGEARSRALSPERRREIAANAGRAKKGFGKLSPAQRRFLARARMAENGTFYLIDEDVITPQRISGWWRTARSLAKRGMVEFVPGVNAYKLTDAARARWAAKKGE